MPLHTRVDCEAAFIIWNMLGKAPDSPLRNKKIRCSRYGCRSSVRRLERHEVPTSLTTFHRAHHSVFPREPSEFNLILGTIKREIPFHTRPGALLCGPSKRWMMFSGLRFVRSPQRDEDFFDPFNPVVVSLRIGGGPDVCKIRPCIRFGEAHGPWPVAAKHPGDEELFSSSRMQNFSIRWGCTSGGETGGPCWKA